MLSKKLYDLNLWPLLVPIFTSILLVGSVAFNESKQASTDVLSVEQRLEPLRELEQDLSQRRMELIQARQKLRSIILRFDLMPAQQQAQLVAFQALSLQQLRSLDLMHERILHQEQAVKREHSVRERMLENRLDLMQGEKPFKTTYILIIFGLAAGTIIYIKEKNVISKVDQMMIYQKVRINYIFFSPEELDEFEGDLSEILGELEEKGMSQQDIRRIAVKENFEFYKGKFVSIVVNTLRNFI